MEVELTDRQGPVRCAVCHDELASQPVACDGCGTVLHAECKDPVHGCPTIGCRNRVVPVTDQAKVDGERSRARRLSAVATLNGAAALYLGWLCHLLIERAPPAASLTLLPILPTFAASALLGALTLLLTTRVWRRSRSLGLLPLSLVTAWLVVTGSQLATFVAWTRPVTAVEAREWADRIDRGHASVFERIDVDAFIGHALTEKERKSFQNRFREGQAAAWRSVAADGGSVGTLRVTIEGRAILTVRIVDRSGALAYHELVLARGRDGEPTCVRFRNLRLLEDWFTIISRVEDASSRRRYQLQSLRKSLNDDDPGAVLRAFRRLSASAKTDRDILLLRLEAAQQLGEDEAEALADVIATTDGDPAILRLELAQTREDEVAVLEALDAIDRMVGGDPFLDALRADAKNVEGGSSEALELATRATVAVPTVEATWWSLLECAVALRAHARTRAALEQLVGRFRNEQVDIEENLDLGEFLSSDEGATWLARNADPR